MLIGLLVAAAVLGAVVFAVMYLKNIEEPVSPGRLEEAQEEARKAVDAVRSQSQEMQQLIDAAVNIGPGGNIGAGPDAAPAQPAPAPPAPQEIVSDRYRTYADPFPVTWKDAASARFGISSVEVKDSPEESSLYIELGFHIKAGSQCIPMGVKRVINEFGLLEPPLTPSFVFGDTQRQPPDNCPKPYATYTDQKVTFLAPSGETRYLFDTGAIPRVRFFINVSPSGIEVAPEN